MSYRQPRYGLGVGPMSAPATPASLPPPTPGERRGWSGTAAPTPPEISLPNGGGALRGIDEQFQTNAVNGTAALAIPLPITQARGDATPQLGLAYDSGAGNGPFGCGWRLTMPVISRRTDRGVPQYRDAEDSDTFTVSGGEDLVPVVGPGGLFSETRTVGGVTYRIRRYRPRVEADFSRFEHWCDQASGETHWRVINPSNVTSIFGRSPDARTADPDDPGRVFSWMLEFTYDDKGNCIEYQYRPEDLRGVDTTSASERHRLEGRARIANTYLKRVRYGNTSPFHPNGPAVAGYHFELVFDYGEHDPLEPLPDEPGAWPVRPDPFSSYRSGFEIRTYRRCERVLMFHRFEELGAEPELVSSLRLTHATHAPGHSFLVEAEVAGHLPAQGGGYTTKTLPPLTIDYQPLEWDTKVRELDDESAEHLPSGVDGVAYQWVDLEGTGLPGVLIETPDAWHFKPNLGGGRFGARRTVAPKPSFTGLVGGALQLLDLEADGRLHAATLLSTPQGAFAPDGDGWEPFRPFASAATVDVTRARLVDLTGDGRADLLVDEDDAICWFASLGAEGFAAPERVRRRLDDDAAPQLVFAGSSEAVFLADMSGDGLADIVRVRNAEISYWPNLGYGRFGTRVMMAAAPRLDDHDAFDPDRIRLADIDGSGPADLIYLGRDRLRLWTNAAGDAWSDTALEIDALPHLHSAAAVDVVDLMGTGTACVVWSSPLPSDAAHPIRFIDLTASTKPHLMTGYRNNAGKEVRIGYAPSTRHFLDDAAAGTPWASCLPFPVHCVTTIETVDHVTDTRLRSRYRYHHGFYDRAEREFCGFGRVDQLDTETFEDSAALGGANVVDEDLHQPPILTKTWFHTGQWIGHETVLRHFAAQYYRNAVLPEHPLPEPALPPGLTPREQREAVRACRGMALRSEVFGLDGSDDEPHPYVVTETSCAVASLQPSRSGQPAAFQVTPAETITYHYERRTGDPRVAHTVVLDRDELGNVRRAASMVYARATSDPSLPAAVQATQAQTFVTVTENDFTNDVDVDVPVPAYRLRMPWRSRVYELTGAPPADRFYTAAELRAAFAAATDLPFESAPVNGTRRLLADQRTAYWRDDLTGRLAFGTVGPLGMPFESYRLAFTPTLLDDLYGGRVDGAVLAANGYVQIDGAWWIPSGRSVFAPDAPQHYYLPSAARDPLGNETTVTYDAHDLLVEQVTDALGNTVTARIDYRAIGPDVVTDANGNRSAVQRDELGLVVATAAMGKAGSGEGDALADPTVRFEYDLTEWTTKQRPNFVKSIFREEHGVGNTRFQERYAYFDGFGNVVMSKVQAEPGIARRFDPVTGNVEEVDSTPALRWIGNGRRVLNNKGNPVRQYEPYFAVTHEYEDAAELVETGATTILHYDPLGRVVRTDLPDGTFTRSETNPWRNVLFDAADTVLDSTWYVERGSPDPSAAEPADPDERAAWLSAQHASTPAVVHVDSVGRPVYAVADNGLAGTRTTRAELDVTGGRFRLFDARGRLIASGQSNLAGAICRAESAERGERWTLVSATGHVVWASDAHGRTFRTEYDALLRPVRAFVQEGNAPAILAALNVWGEEHPDSEDRNLRGRLYRSYDQGGTAANVRHDFKGNATTTERRFATDYRHSVDWSTLTAAADLAGIEAAAEPQLLADTFSASAEHDALNRVTATTLPDGTRLRPSYNEANIVEALEAQLGGAGPFVPIVIDRDFDAKGQLTSTELANGTVTTRTYDPQTLRLTRLASTRVADNAVLQDLRYTYDAAGNVTECTDSSQQTLFFDNAVVPPVWRYAYDALYQLVSATGREHAGIPGPANHELPDANALPHPNDAAAVRNYRDTYEYDELGNILRVHHAAGAGTWNRGYRYRYQDDPNDRTNRLAATSLPGDAPQGPFSATYDHDALGNITRMPHLASLEWEFGDRLRRVDLGGGGQAFYVYGVNGQRLRKVVERTASHREERFYLGTVELEREIQNDVVVLAREVVHLGIDGPVAEAVTKTVDASEPAGLNQPVLRYQHGNVLGSASLETDEQGQLISYEEYHPYGTTAYRAGRSQAEASLKRYRFVGEERDDETGMYLFGLRYYLPWLGRWASPDPVGLAAGDNLYRYAANNPIVFIDPGGAQEQTVVGTVAPPRHLQARLTENTASARRALERWAVGRHVNIGEGEAKETRRITGVQWHEGAWALTTELVAPSQGGDGEGGHGGEGPGTGTGTGQGGQQGNGDANAPPKTPPTTNEMATESTEPQTETETSDPSAPRPDPATHAGPAVERGIWGRSFRDRGFTLEHLYNNDIPNALRAQGDNRPLYDVETDTTVKQIKSSNGNSETLRSHASKATRDAGQAVRNNPTGTMTGKSPQAVVITTTDAPSTAGADIRGGFDDVRRPVPNSVPPEHVRGIPGATGQIGRGLTVGGSVLSGGFLIHNLVTGDYALAGADAISTLGGGLEIYAIASPGATVAGASAMSAGLALGGVGIAVGSGISAYRAYQRGDTAGVVAGVVGVLAGIAITAGVIFGAPALIVGGLIAAVGVGLFHLGRWLFG